MSKFQQVVALYQRLLTLNMALQEEADFCKNAVNTARTLEEVADIDNALFRCSEMLDQIAKEFRALVRHSEKILCLRWTAESLTGEPIRTDYVTSSPRMKMMPKLPTLKADPENYRKLCASLGISEEACNSEFARPHWPGLNALIDRCNAEGEPLPEGLLNETFPEFKVTRRKRKELSED